MHLHPERHFRAGETVRDIVLGLSDGLTVPFALAAGVSAAIPQASVVVTAGLAEIVAGAISMGLGGFLAARTDYERYRHEERREIDEVHNKADVERAEVREIFESYGLHGEALDQLVTQISKDKSRWVDFMMRFELGMEKPDGARAPLSAITIGASYAAGGLIPLIPYMLTSDVRAGLLASTIVTVIALLIFGAIKSKLTGSAPLRGAWQTALIGAVAAGVAFGLARALAPGAGAA